MSFGFDDDENRNTLTQLEGWRGENREDKEDIPNRANVATLRKRPSVIKKTTCAETRIKEEMESEVGVSTRAVIGRPNNNQHEGVYTEPEFEGDRLFKRAKAAESKVPLIRSISR